MRKLFFLFEHDKYRRDDIFRVGFTPYSNLILNEGVHRVMLLCFLGNILTLMVRANSEL